jgi:formylglycine-generating enzyme required for sulfatase activity
MEQRRPLERGAEIVMNLDDTKSPSDREQSFEHPADDGMLSVPGGTYRMGSDKHYPEEAPVHRVTVAEFWMDRTGYQSPIPQIRQRDRPRHLRRNYT